MSRIIRMGVTKDVIDKIGKETCLKIAATIIESYDFDADDIDEEYKEIDCNIENFDHEISMICIYDSKIITTLVGMADNEPWTGDEDNPEPLYDKISEWFEL